MDLSDEMAALTLTDHEQLSDETDDEQDEILSETLPEERAWPLPDCITAEILARLGDTTMVVRSSLVCRDFYRAATEYKFCYEHIHVDLSEGDGFLVATLTDSDISSLVARASVIRSIVITDRSFDGLVTTSFLLDLDEVQRISLETLAISCMRVLDYQIFLPVLPTLVNLTHLEISRSNCPMSMVYRIATRSLPMLEVLITVGSGTNVDDTLTRSLAVKLLKNCKLRVFYARLIHMPDGALELMMESRHSRFWELFYVMPYDPPHA